MIAFLECTLKIDFFKGATKLYITPYFSVAIILFKRVNEGLNFLPIVFET